MGTTLATLYCDELAGDWDERRYACLTEHGRFRIGTYTNLMLSSQGASEVR